jgi:branched-chain amino acid aminotransferase
MLQRYDERNADLRYWVNGVLRHRDEPGISPFDSVVQGGDAVWEGLRLYDGKIYGLSEHLARLRRSAAALGFTGVPDESAVVDALRETLRANGMTDGVHVRLMVTRGVKSTPYQDPRVTVGPATVVIVAEHKEPAPATLQHGIRLFTVHVRRPGPDIVDPKLNAHSKLNDITACIQAYTAGADEALMLDPHGFVATCNSTHFFVVRRGELWTSSGQYCLGGITRSTVLEVARAAGIPAYERSFSLTDVYGADEAFVTGTFAGLVPVREVDGRSIGWPSPSHRPDVPGADAQGDGVDRPVTDRLRALYLEAVSRDVAVRAATRGGKG